jgi:hypothetical protein
MVRSCCGLIATKTTIKQGKKTPVWDAPPPPPQAGSPTLKKFLSLFPVRFFTITLRTLILDPMHPQAGLIGCGCDQPRFLSCYYINISGAFSLSPLLSGRPLDSA